MKIEEDGEILCKGPSLMLGYYKDPKMTKQVIDEDGWFHTGDIGHIGKEGQLKITGRKKEIFKTSFGKYINPQQIENKFKESSFIDALMVIGENQKFAAALIVPDFEYLKSWCKVKEIEFTTDIDMIELPRIKKRFQKEINKYNTFFGATEKIKRFKLMDTIWDVKTGEMTATLKLKRNFISNKYKSIINDIFDIVEEE